MLSTKLIINPATTQGTPGSGAINPQLEAYNLGANVNFGPFDVSKCQGFGVYFANISGNVTGILSIQGYIGDVQLLQNAASAAGNTASNTGSGFLNTATSRLIGFGLTNPVTISTLQMTGGLPQFNLLQVTDPYFNIAYITWVNQASSSNGIIRVFTKGAGS